MDRRTVWAILLMMAIAIAPAVLIKRPPKSAAPAPGHATPHDSSAVAAPSPARPDTLAVPPADTAAAAATAQPADTVRVTSPLYTYSISTIGGRLVAAKLWRYRSMAPGDARAVAEILPPQSRLLGMSLVLGSDTVSL